jgi:hypothetical protein
VQEVQNGASSSLDVLEPWVSSYQKVVTDVV